jgi:hypothetical protein
MSLTGAKIRHAKMAVAAIRKTKPAFALPTGPELPAILPPYLPLFINHILTILLLTAFMIHWQFNSHREKTKPTHCMLSCL